MTIDQMMADIALALPDKRRSSAATVHEVSITRYEDGSWHAMAGGHPSVSIGEYGGDYDSDGHTPEDALSNLMAQIKSKS